MTVGTILVSLTTPQAAERVLGTACALARRHNAHLIGLHSKESIAIYPGIAMHMALPDLDAFERAQEEQAQKVRKIFDDHTKGEDFVSEWRYVHAASMSAADRIIDHARAADLLVMAQEDPETDRVDQANIQSRAIRETGRPVLVIPYAGSFAEIGAHALVGWSPTREAARAAHDAIPLLSPGGRASILTAHPAHEKDALAQDTARELALCYDRNGIKAEVVDRTDDGIAIGNVLLNEAFERGCDMIVTGAFGHSRLYDFVIGATTSHLLGSMTVPVLFSS